MPAPQEVLRIAAQAKLDAIARGKYLFASKVEICSTTGPGHFFDHGWWDLQSPETITALLTLVHHYGDWTGICAQLNGAILANSETAAERDVMDPTQRISAKDIQDALNSAPLSRENLSRFFWSEHPIDQHGILIARPTRPRPGM